MTWFSPPDARSKRHSVSCYEVLDYICGIIFSMNSFMLNKTCIVLLACNDYESTQLTVANLIIRTPPNIPIYFLPNSISNSFDARMVKEIGTIYSKLFPGRLIYVNWVKPSFPYQAIGDLLYSEQLKKYEYICKIDDDVFPITDNWLEELAACFKKHENEELAYVTGLINNNPWGFAELVDIMGLQDEYSSLVPRYTIGGKNIQGYMQEEKVEKPDISRGGFGTVWQFPHLARWIHQKTSMQPEQFIDKTRGLEEKEIDNQIRYSIGCMLFRKAEWAKIYTGSKTDEKMWHIYCRQNDKKIISARSVPMVHLFFYNQRLFNKSILEKIYNVYRKFNGEKLTLLWDNSRECKFSFMEERIREIEAGKHQTSKMNESFRKLKNTIRYRFFRRW